MILEIYTDASIKTYPNGRVFGCSGAICPIIGQSSFTINQDTTNNQSELIAIYIGIKLAKQIIDCNPLYKEIHLYSDSQFGIFGLSKWMNGWVKTLDSNEIIYGSNKEPVKNQQLFYMILEYLCENNLRIKLFHQPGHIAYNNPMKLKEANEVFKKSNGYYISEDDIYKISFYNDLVDRATRTKLENIDPSNYLMFNGNKQICTLKFPLNYKDYIIM